MDSAVTASETLVMAGRTFRLALPLSMGQRVYWDVVLRRAGVRTAPQTVEAWDAVVGQLEATDQLQYLVACCLVDAGQTWMRAAAEANAAFFWALTDAEDLRQLQYVIGAVLLRFFPLGRTSPATSPNSSNAATSMPPSTIPGAPAPSAVASATTPAVTSSTAPGAPSSAASPTDALTATAGS
jgi:hypothetical protein